MIFICRFSIFMTFFVHRVSDSHLFTVDPDLVFHLNADPDPAYHFNMDPNADPASHQGDANLRPLSYRPSRPPFRASTPPF
jgi:hypothetical protein